MNIDLEDEMTYRYPGSASRTTLIPFDKAASGRLIFTSSVDRLTLLAAPGLHGLAQAEFSSSFSWIGIEPGVLMTAFRSENSPARTDISAAPDDAITLNASIPWEIEFRGTVSRLTARLHGLRLRSLDFLGDANLVTLALSGVPVPAYLYIAGKASYFRLYRTKGTGITITSRSSIKYLKMDGQQFSSTSPNFHLESRVSPPNPSVYNISFANGADGVLIEEF